MLRDGGLIGGSTFASNHALARGGGAAFVSGDACLVQDSVFEANSAAVEGGAVFVYGRAMFHENAFEGNSAGNTHPDVYACSNADECGAFTRDTATASARPGSFASARRKTAVYERPTEREETGTYAGERHEWDGIDGDGDGDGGSRHRRRTRDDERLKTS